MGRKGGVEGRGCGGGARHRLAVWRCAPVSWPLGLMALVLLGACAEPDYRGCERTVAAERSVDHPAFLVVRPDPAMPLGCPGVPPGVDVRSSVACDLTNREVYATNKPCIGPPTAPYLIMEQPVSAADWERCVAAGSCGSTPNVTARDSGAVEMDGELAVFDGQEYCAFIGARRCTEPEWERAARGNEGYVFPWGDADLGACRGDLSEDEFLRRDDVSAFGVRETFSGFEAVAGYYNCYDICYPLQTYECRVGDDTEDCGLPQDGVLECRGGRQPLYARTIASSVRRATFRCCRDMP